MTFAHNRYAVSSFVGLFALGAWACAPNVKTALGPQGSHIITCSSGMNACVARASKICGDDGYTILEGVNRTKLLGGASSSYRARSDVGQLTVHCGLPEEMEERNRLVFKLPERTDEPIVAEEPTMQATAATGAVCTPGATQACVGPGACQGGQTCLETGRGYGPCDCGDAGPKKPASERAVAPANEASSGPSTVGTEKKGDSPAPSVPAVPGVAPTPTPLGQQK